MDRATAVVRGTHSANFYEMPLLSPSRAAEQPAFASTWGPSSSSKSTASFGGSSGGVRRGTTPRDLNASFHHTAPDARMPSGRSSSRASSRNINADEPQFQPAFAFDVNELVSSLRRSASSSSLSMSAPTSSSAAMGNSSLTRTTSGHGWQNRFTQHSQHAGGSGQYPEQLAFGDGRIETEPALPRRGRRDALSGSENSHTQAPAPPQSNPNSIIAYSLNRRKKKPIVGMPTSAAPPSPAPGGAPHHPHQQQQHNQQHQQHYQQYSTPSSTSSRIPSPPPPSTTSSSSSRPSHQQQYYQQQEFRPTTTIITPNGIEYTTEVPTRTTRVTSFYEESFTF